MLLVLLAAGCSSNRFQLANARDREWDNRLAANDRRPVVPPGPPISDLPPAGIAERPGGAPQPIPAIGDRRGLADLPPEPGDNPNLANTGAGNRRRTTQTPRPGPPGSQLELASDGPQLVGRVVNSYGRPEPRASLQVIEVGSSRRIVAEAVSASDGTFRVVNLRPGAQYEVVAATTNKGVREIGTARAVVPQTNVLVQLEDESVASSPGLRPRSRTAPSEPLAPLAVRGQPIAAPVSNPLPGSVQVSTPTMLQAVLPVPVAPAERPPLASSNDPRQPLPARTPGEGYGIPPPPNAVAPLPPGVQPNPQPTFPSAQPTFIQPQPGAVAPAGPGPAFTPAPVAPFAPASPTVFPQPGSATDQDWAPVVPNAAPTNLAPAPPPAPQGGAFVPIAPAAPYIPSAGPHSSTTKPTVVQPVRSPARVAPSAAFAGTRLAAANLLALDQKPRSLGTLEGDLILLDFFGSWCGPCRRCVPKLNDLHERYSNRGLRIVGVACEGGDDAQAVAATHQVRQQLAIRYSVLTSPMDRTCGVRDYFHVHSFPTLVLLDRQGRVLFQASGGDARTLARLESAIQSNLPRTVAGL